MSEFNIDFKWIGYTGVIIMQLSYLPQLKQIITTHNVAGLSVGYFAMLALGISLLQVYSWKRKDLVYVIANWWALFNSCLILLLIWFFR